MSDRNRAFTRPLKNANSNASDYVNNLRAKVKFAGTSNLARTVAAQGGMLPLRTPQGHLKPYQGTYGFSATTVTANSPKTYCLNTSRSYRDLLDITKGKYLLTPPNPVANTITIDNTEPSELYNGVFFENVYKGNAESIYSTTGFGIDNNNIIYATSNPLAPSNSNQLIFVDPSYNMFYESQSCLEDSTYFRNIQIRTDLGVTGKEHLDRVLNLYLLNGFKYPSKFSLDYNSGDCINANNLLQTPPCPPCSLQTIATEGPTNTWTTNSNVTILPCQTLTILAGQTLNIGSLSILNNYGTIINNGTFNVNGTITNYNDGIINNNAGGIINNNSNFFNSGTITNAGTITNTGTITSTGTITIITGGVITNTGIITNSSTITTNSGTITNNVGGTINNNNGGTITTISSSINNSAGGTINNNTGGVINNNSTSGISNSGIIINHTGATIANPDSGNITNYLTITNSGTITISNSSVIINQGTGTITNNAGSTITIATGSSTNYGTFTNYGTITIDSTSVFQNLNNMSTAGLITNDGASASITNAGNIANSNNSTITNTNSATITNNSGATITNSGFAPGIIYNKFSGIITNNIGATFANTTATFINYSVTESAVFTNNGTYTGNAPILS